MGAHFSGENELRLSAEASLSSEFKSGLQELRAMVVSMATSETDRELEPSSMLELFEKAEREMRENGDRLQKEIAGKQVEASCVLELCKQAEREMRENGARLQKEIADSLQYLLRQAAIVASTAAETPTVKQT